jgi:hypothetical protein
MMTPYGNGLQALTTDRRAFVAFFPDQRHRFFTARSIESLSAICGCLMRNLQTGST